MSLLNVTVGGCARAGAGRTAPASRAPTMPSRDRCVTITMRPRPSSASSLKRPPQALEVQRGPELDDARGQNARDLPIFDAERLRPGGNRVVVKDVESIDAHID